jgi:hypothetical protein
MEATEIHDAFLKILEDALIRVHPGNAFKGVKLTSETSC